MNVFQEMLCGCKSWSATASEEWKLQVTQRAMKRCSVLLMTNCILKIMLNMSSKRLRKKRANNVESMKEWLACMLYWHLCNIKRSKGKPHHTEWPSCRECGEYGKDLWDKKVWVDCNLHHWREYPHQWSNSAIKILKYSVNSFPWLSVLIREEEQL